MTHTYPDTNNTSIFLSRIHQYPHLHSHNAVYGMALDLATFLAVYGTLFDGNAVSLDPGYSIGGATASQSILGGLGGLLRTPGGLSGSHNNYEGDTSPTRGDLYVA